MSKSENVSINFDFEKLYQGIRKETVKILEVSSQEIVDDAKILCPLDANSENVKHTRDTIDFKINNKKQNPVVSSTIKTNSNRGLWLEYGTASSSLRPWSTKPHPFMQPALVKNRAKYIKRFEDLLNDDSFMKDALLK